jgi:hypothetical protein
MTVFCFFLAMHFAMLCTIDAFCLFLLIRAPRLVCPVFLTTLLHEMMGSWCDGLTTLNMRGEVARRNISDTLCIYYGKRDLAFFLEHEKGEAFLGDGYGEEVGGKGEKRLFPNSKNILLFIYDSSSLHKPMLS